jgi:hypothetical protein
LTPGGVPDETTINLAPTILGLLAWNRFDGPMPPAALWVLWTYHLSLWWIARSGAREGSIVEAGALQ